MDNNNLPAWTRLALAGSVDEVVLDPNTFHLSKTIAGESWGDNRPEQAGYFSGVLRNGKFLVFLNTPLGNGWNGSSDIYDTRNMYNVYEKRLAKALNGYYTLMYHSHPKITPEILKRIHPEEYEAVINFAEEEIKSGIWNYLLDEGRETDLETVLNELFAKQIHPKDIENTFGDYHIIITPTVSQKNETSHLNLHNVKNNSLAKIRAMNYSEINSLKGTFDIGESVRKKWLKDVYGTSNMERIAGNKQLKRRYWAINQGYIEPELKD